MEDVQLLDAMLRGDRDAFVEVVRRYQPSLVRVARLYVASDASAEDVAQETWVAVLKGLEHFEGRSSFKTWLFRICANRARSIGVREHRSVAVDTTDERPSVDARRFDADGMWSDPPVPFTELVEGRLDSQIVIAELRSAIEALGEPARAVVTLRDIEGLSSAEVAEILDMSDGNVRVVLHRARARLRAAIEEQLKGARQ